MKPIRIAGRRLVLSVELLVFLIGFSPSATAETGLSMSVENLFAPLGKQVETLQAGNQRQVGFGRETAEFVGIEGFTDLNLNWRAVYGLQATLLGAPMVKLSGGIAFMINTPYTIPLRPFVLLTLDPLFSANPALPPFGFTMHTGLGLEYSWNNTLYTQILLKMYLLNPFGSEKEKTLQTNWNPGTFSLSAGMGYLF